MPTEFIHQFIPATDADRRTLLVLHGTGGNEHDLVAVARAVSPTAAILSPRGRVLERGMPRFFRRLSEGVFDLDDLRLRTRELAEFVRWASDEYGCDPSRIHAVGYSNGANVAASLLLSFPDLLAGAVLFRAMVPFEPIQMPPSRSTPVLILAGRHDPVVSAPLVERLSALLESGGARVTLAWQEAGHQLTRPELDLAAGWFMEHAARA